MYDKLDDDGELDPEWKGNEPTDQQQEPPRLNRILHKSSDGDGGTNRYEIVCNFDLDGKS